MKIEALRALVKLAENGCDFSVHQQLGISRSDLWFLITRLEKEMGITLIRRKKQNNSLTEEAYYFLPYVQHIVTHLEEGLQKIASFKKSNF